MELYFYVDGLHIELVDKQYVVNDSQNLIKAYFSFSGEMWTKCSVKTAIFHYNGTAYSMLLDDCWCYVPAEVLKGEFFSVGMSVSYIEDEVNKCIYSDLYEVETNKSCYSDIIANSYITPTEAEQIRALLEQMRDDMDAYVTHEHLSEVTGGVDIPLTKEQVDANLSGIMALMERMDRCELSDDQIDKQISEVTDEQDRLNSELSDIKNEMGNFVTNDKLDEVTGGVNIPATKAQVDANLAGILNLMTRVDSLESMDVYINSQLAGFDTVLDKLNGEVV